MKAGRHEGRQAGRQVDEQADEQERLSKALALATISDSFFPRIWEKSVTQKTDQIPICIKQKMKQSLYLFFFEEAS